MPIRPPARPPHRRTKLAESRTGVCGADRGPPRLPWSLVPFSPGPGAGPGRHAARGRRARYTGIRHRRHGICGRVRAEVHGRAPRAGRPSTLHHRRDRGAGGQPASGIGPARAGRPAARELGVRVRRGRAGPALGEHPDGRGERLPDHPARHPAGARVRRAHQRVPGRGRRPRRGPRGRHDPPGGLPVHLVPGVDDADALRRRAQLPAPGQGDEARERRLVRRRRRSPATASSTATSTARSATSRRWSGRPSRP